MLSNVLRICVVDRLTVFSLLVSLQLSSLVHANENQILENLVFVPMSISEQLELHQTPVQDSQYSNLLANIDSQSFLKNISDPVASFQASEYENRIYAIEGSAGPFSPELTEVLHSLGTYYLKNRQYDEALASFEREEYINRIHFGLYSEALIPAIKSQIRVLKESGRHYEVDDKHRSILYILGKCYGNSDLRILPEVMAFAEWNRERFNEIVRHELSSMPLLGLGSGFGTRDELRAKAFENLDEAAIQYARALSLLIKNQQWSDPTLFHLENRLLETAFLQASRQQVIRDPDEYLYDQDLEELMYQKGDYARLASDAYHYGIKSYDRQLQYLRNDPNGSVGRYVDTLMAYGDWYLLFGKQGAATAKYNEAHDLLASYDMETQTISGILMPEIPVSLPQFTATPHSLPSLEQQDRMINPYRGYIDVSFRINRNGDARNVEVLSSSDNTSNLVEKRLLRTISNSQFRPALNEDNQGRYEQIALRYYYTY